MKDYTVEDVRRLVPEAGEIFEGADCIYIVIDGCIFEYYEYDIIITSLLSTRARLEVAASYLGTIANMTINPDKTMTRMGLEETVDGCRNASSQALAKIKEMV